MYTKQKYYQFKINTISLVRSTNKTLPVIIKTHICVLKNCVVLIPRPNGKLIPDLVTFEFKKQLIYIFKTKELFVQSASVFY